MLPRRVLLPGVVLAIGLSALPVWSQTVTEATVALAADWLETYTAEIGGVVLEEKYLQQAQGRVVMARELESDLAIIADPRFGWIEFRDVYAVDGEAIRDRQDRVIELFSSPREDALAQAQRIVQEGARHNLSPVGVQFARTINLPLAALMYLRADNQARSTFQRQSAESLHDRPVLLVRFEEQESPRLIGSVDGAPARGQFWIDRETGQVLRSILSIESRRGTTTINASIDVDYRLVEDLGIWLPQSMEESYDFYGSQGQVLASISGRALYSNYRKFSVQTDEGVVEEDSVIDEAPVPDGEPDGSPSG